MPCLKAAFLYTALRIASTFPKAAMTQYLHVASELWNALQWAPLYSESKSGNFGVCTFEVWNYLAAKDKFMKVFRQIDLDQEKL